MDGLIGRLPDQINSLPHLPSVLQVNPHPPIDILRLDFDSNPVVERPVERPEHGAVGDQLEAGGD